MADQEFAPQVILVHHRKMLGKRDMAQVMLSEVQDWFQTIQTVYGTDVVAVDPDSGLITRAPAIHGDIALDGTIAVVPPGVTAPTDGQSNGEQAPISHSPHSGV